MNDRIENVCHTDRGTPACRAPEKRERPVAVLFADLEGCTRLCEAGVRRAARAAVAVQKQARELNAQQPSELDPVLVNIGIHAGSAFVGVTKFRSSGTEHRTYTASGPVSNIGSRLCARATGGSILVSAEVAAQLDGAGFALEPLGALTLKNVSRPVSAFRLSGANTGR